MRMFKSVLYSFAALFVVHLTEMSAFAVTTSGISYQGRILKPNGEPLEGANVQFRFQLRSPDTNNCLMFEEQQMIDMRNSNGSFALTLNDGSGLRTDSTGLGLDEVFSNRTNYSFVSTTCTSGSTYNPGQNDGRKLVVFFKDETMATWEPMGAQGINYVPYAFEARHVEGFSASNLLRFAESDGTLVNTTPLNNAQYTELVALVNGTSTRFAKTGELGGVALPTLGAGQAGQVLSWTGTGWTTAASAVGADSVSTTNIVNGTITGADLATNIAISTTNTIATSGTVSSNVATARDFRIYDSDATPNENYISIKAPTSLAANYNYVWPLNYGSANQILTTDGAGGLTWAPAAASSQWVNGASNSISYSAGNVGIGTTVPSAPLHIVSPGTAAYPATSGATQSSGLIARLHSTNSSYALDIGSAGSVGGSWLQSNNTNGLSAHASILLNPNGGSVGIGTTVPTSLAQVGTTLNSVGWNIDGALTTYRLNPTGSYAGSGHFRTQVSNSTAGDYANSTYSELDITSPSSYNVGRVADIEGYHKGVGHLNTLIGAMVYLENDGQGTVDEFMGFKAETNTANAVTRNYGIFIDDQSASGAAQNFNLYSAGTGTNYFGGKVGIGTTAPTAALNFKAGTAAAGSAPLKFTQGTLLTTPEDGAMEYDASGIWFTIGSTRYLIPVNTAAGNYSNVQTIGNTTGSITMTPLAGNSVIVNSAAVSTSSTTGALVVNGGVGVAGAINSAGNITSGGTVSATNSMISPQIYGSTAASGNIKIDGTSDTTKGNVLLATAGGRVGIGTTTPLYPLDVFGSLHVGTGDSGAYIGSAGAAQNVSCGGASYLSGTYTAKATSATCVSQVAGNISITSDNTTAGNTFVPTSRLYVQSGGNVGIGSTAPTTGLSINQGGNAANGLTTFFNQSLGNYRGIIQHAYNGQGINSAGGLQIAAQGSDNSSNGSGNINFFTSLTGANATTDGTYVTAMTIRNITGNVGIGTTAPASPLHVIGDVRTSTGLVISGYGGVSYVSGHGVQLSSGSSSNPISFGNGGSSEYMRIDGSTGNVGIGTTAPSFPLDIAYNAGGASTGLQVANLATTGANTDTRIKLGAGTAVAQIQLLGSSATTDAGSLRIAGNGPIAFLQSGSEVMRVSAGNVGIGTTAPSQTFEISNSVANSGPTMRLSGQPTGNYSGAGVSMVGAIEFYNKAATNLGLAASIVAGRGQGVASSGELHFLTSPSGAAPVDRMMIDRNGYVGIGTTLPRTPLHVSVPTAFSTGVTVQSLTGTETSLQPGAFSKPALLAVVGGDVTNTNAVVGVLQPNVSLAGLIGPSLDLASSRSTTAQLASGVYTPVVSGDGLGYVNFGGDDTVNYRGIGAQIGSFAEGTWSSTSHPAGIRFFTAPAASVTRAEVMRITSSALVGIGTTNPTQMLEVAGTAKANIFVTPSVNGTAGNVQIGVGDFNTGLFRPAGNNLAIATAGAERMRIDASGNVAIGITSAVTEKLVVAGNIAPSVTDTYNLGTSSILFNNAYVKNGVTTTSDARKKKEIRDSDLGLDFVNSLRPVSYYWKDGSDNKVHYGVIAQEAEASVAKAKQKSKRTNEVDNVIVTHDKKTDAYGVRYTELIAPVIKAVQELYQSLSTHDRRLASVEAENRVLKQENAAIKAYLCAKDPNAPICH